MAVVFETAIALDTPPQGRPRFTRAGVAYDPPQARLYKARLGLDIVQRVRTRKPLSGALRVELKIYRAGEQFKQRGAINRRFGDIDNLAKIILDAITQTGAVWRDDSQIVELHVVKGIASTARVEIRVEEAEIASETQQATLSQKRVEI